MESEMTTYTFSRFGKDRFMSFDTESRELMVLDHDGQYTRFTLSPEHVEFLFHYGLKQKVFDGGALPAGATEGQKHEAVLKRLKSFALSAVVTSLHDNGAQGRSLSDEEKTQRSLLLAHSRLVNAKKFKKDEEHTQWALARVGSPLAARLVENAKALADDVDLE
jgi:hypothetical protein